MAAGRYRIHQKLLAISFSILLVPGGVPWASAYGAQQETESAKIPTDQLDSLVAPIALYPDPLLAQVLAASTYPLEIIQLQQWLAKNKGLTGKALTDAALKQDWDPSVQALAELPDVANRLANDIKWTTDLGNAFLAQQSDVMDAVQRMRAKAQNTGNLKSSSQQKVETQVIENKSVIVVQPADPQVVYVPSYNPTVVYGPPPYPYPPIYYPPPGYYAAGMAISFGVGMAIGAAWGGGGWGWGCGWGGHSNVTINNNNNFVRNSNRQNINYNSQNIGNRTGSNNWTHNPQHRGGAPYANRSTADRFGGSYQGQSASSRQANARQQIQSGQRQGGLGGQQGVGNRAAGAANLGGAGASRGGAGTSGDRIGNRNVSSGAASRGGGAFSGSGGMSGSSARASSTRGASSMGGAGSRGGGGGGRRR